MFYIIGLAALVIIARTKIVKTTPALPKVYIGIIARKPSQILLDPEDSQIRSNKILKFLEYLGAQVISGGDGKKSKVSTQVSELVVAFTYISPGNRSKLKLSTQIFPLNKKTETNRGCRISDRNLSRVPTQACLNKNILRTIMNKQKRCTWTIHRITRFDFYIWIIWDVKTHPVICSNVPRIQYKRLLKEGSRHRELKVIAHDSAFDWTNGVTYEVLREKALVYLKRRIYRGPYKQQLYVDVHRPSALLKFPGCDSQTNHIETSDIEISSSRKDFWVKFATLQLSIHNMKGLKSSKTSLLQECQDERVLIYEVTRSGDEQKVTEVCGRFNQKGLPAFYITTEEAIITLVQRCGTSTSKVLADVTKCSKNEQQIENGQVIFNRSMSGHTARMKCKSRFVLESDATAKWTCRGANAIARKCVPVTCDPLDLKATHEKISKSQPIRISETVTVVCKEGFKHFENQNPIVTCLKNGRWSHKPKCITVPKTQPSTSTEKVQTTKPTTQLLNAIARKHSLKATKPATTTTTTRTSTYSTTIKDLPTTRSKILITTTPITKRSTTTKTINVPTTAESPTSEQTTVIHTREKPSKPTKKWSKTTTTIKFRKITTKTEPSTTTSKLATTTTASTPGILMFPSKTPVHLTTKTDDLSTTKFAITTSKIPKTTSKRSETTTKRLITPTDGPKTPKYPTTKITIPPTTTKLLLPTTEIRIAAVTAAKHLPLSVKIITDENKQKTNIVSIFTKTASEQVSSSLDVSLGDASSTAMTPTSNVQSSSRRILAGPLPADEKGFTKTGTNTSVIILLFFTALMVMGGAASYYYIMIRNRKAKKVLKPSILTTRKPGEKSKARQKSKGLMVEDDLLRSTVVLEETSRFDSTLPNKSKKAA